MGNIAGGLVGVATVGRAVCKFIDKERVVEVNRCATDGTKNACSFLYAAAAEVARLLGFYAIITYTLDSESGASLRALGWWPEYEATPGRSWNKPKRPRKKKKGDALGAKTRWLKVLNDFEAFVPKTKADERQLDLLTPR